MKRKLTIFGLGALLVLAVVLVLASRDEKGKAAQATSGQVGVGPNGKLMAMPGPGHATMVVVADLPQATNSASSTITAPAKK
jgi:hypothetical protein